jgi:hypothetical protein
MSRKPVPKKERQVKTKVKHMLIIFFDIKRIVHKEFVLADQQSIRHTTVTFYDDCMKMCKDFGPNFGDKRTGCSFTTKYPLTVLFSRNNNVILVKNYQPPPTLSVSTIEDKAEMPPF